MTGTVRRACRVGAAATLCFVVLAVLIASRWPPLMAADRGVAERAYRLSAGHPGTVAVLRRGSLLVGPLTWLLIAIALAGWQARLRRFRSAVTVLGLILAADLIEYSGKLLLNRGRPSGIYPIAGAGPAARAGSFPSGHSLSAVVGCGAVLWVAAPLLCGRWRWPALGLAVAVVLVAGCSRILLEAHWMSDVIGGWLAGVAVLAVPVTLTGRLLPAEAPPLHPSRLSNP